MTPSLTSPTRIALKKARTASVYRPSDSKPRFAVLLSLALACLTLKPKPFLLLKALFLPLVRTPDATPNLAQLSYFLCPCGALFREMFPALPSLVAPPAYVAIYRPALLLAGGVSTGA